MSQSHSSSGKLLFDYFSAFTIFSLEVYEQTVSFLFFNMEKSTVDIFGHIGLP